MRRRSNWRGIFYNETEGLGSRFSIRCNAPANHRVIATVFVYKNELEPKAILLCRDKALSLLVNIHALSFNDSRAYLAVINKTKIYIPHVALFINAEENPITTFVSGE